MFVNVSMRMIPPLELGPSSQPALFFVQLAIGIRGVAKNVAVGWPV